MLIRSGFVSNSSSSSYIVAYLPHSSTVCPCCHQEVKDLLDLLEDFTNMESYHSESTQIIYDSLDAILEHERSAIKYNQDRINEVKYYKDDEAVSQYANAGQIRQWSQESINESNIFINKLMDFHNANPNHKFIKFQVNHNNTTVKRILETTDDIEIFVEY